jgi:anthranilate synthase component 1
MKQNITSTSTRLEADLVTPVGLFLNIRTHYKQSILLESAAYASRQDHLSFICFDSLAELSIKDGILCSKELCMSDFDITEEIKNFMSSFDIKQDEYSEQFNCIFGFSTFDAVQYFEDIQFDPEKDQHLIPHLRYDFYRFILVFDHYHHELHLIENIPEGDAPKSKDAIKLIEGRDYPSSNFRMIDEEYSSLTDEQYKEMVTKAKAHCKRGDTFQLVLARRFSQKFEGDDFNVYRALRAINPSPYLYYFDYGDYKIFGSSPEAQIKITNGVAEIHPIAGTYRRTGNKTEDEALALKLENDPKEVAEHVMLVDLARNDLSISTNGVHVESFKEAQYFSHVIHLTSVVKGNINKNVSNFKIFADTFPAGTLSGAPKYKAMELISKYEPHSRSFYGGGIGMIHFNGDLNHAIIIRSFLSKDNVLHRQAGAGLVIKSQEESELQEVNNKLAALKKALIVAEQNYLNT